jgi:pimeloyl-ACP methyl ester carboxylesterase
VIRDDRPAKPSQAPLAIYRGEAPPAPQWFKDAMAQAPERSFVPSKGSKIEVLTWGELGKPGLLFVHGNGAHADWWSCIAPFFAADCRVVSMSLAGMGASDWRETYAFTDFADDAEAVARAAGLYGGDCRPIYIGHSFGGALVSFAAAHHPEQMRAAILVDTGYGVSPEQVAAMEKRIRDGVSPIPDRPTRVYRTEADALANFRLKPPQPDSHPFIVDFIARRALTRAPLGRVKGTDNSPEGWTWRFDPRMWSKFHRSGGWRDLADRPGITVPMAHIFADKSRVKERRTAGLLSTLPSDLLEIEIPDAHHHIMVDQPLALVAAIRALLAAWPPARSPS